MKKITLLITLALCMTALAGCQTKAKEEVQSTAKTIEPLPSTLSLEALDDCSFAASFNASDVALNEEGMMCIAMTVYDCDKFDLVDISQLAVSDTIVIDGQDVVVTSLENTGVLVKINGGLDQDGFDLSTKEDGIYIPTLWDDIPLYHSLGEVTLPVDQNFVFTDQSDLENPKKQYFAGDFLTEMESSNEEFPPQATTVVVSGGKIIELTKIYTP